MKLGQTSVIHLGARLVSSAMSFIALVYFSQRLGADVIGRYFLILALVGWLVIIAGTSVALAVTKRMTEEPDEAGHYLVAGMSIQVVMLAGITALLFMFRVPLIEYLGVSYLEFVTLLLAANAAFLFLGGILSGRHKVHIRAILDPVNVLLQRTLQFVGVILGAGLFGLVLGHAGGFILTTVLGTRLYSVTLRLPRRCHYRRLLSYIRYVWLSNTETRVFSTADTLVLGFFVASNFIGAYGIAWNIASLLAIFGYSLSTTVFPEISKRATGPSDRDIGELVTDALAYTGLFLIPGFVGAQLIGARILSIYGEGFVRGIAVLGLLILARLAYGYHGQLINAINAIDRPDIAYRLNLIFIVLNVGLNFALVVLIGWVGAAVASLVSSVLVLSMSSWYGRHLIKFDLPIHEIGTQIVAAGVMGVGVWVIDGAYHLDGSLLSVIIDTSVLVSAGSVMYFVVLYVISPGFRAKVDTNLPYFPSNGG